MLARRTVSFLSQSPLLLEGADHDFYRRFLRAIDEAARELDRDMRFASQPLHRLTAAIALCYVGLCCEGLEARLRRTTAILARELDRQILPDGGHRSRNPKVAIELLLDLLPLRQSYSARSLEPPQALTGAIDRMLPLLRLLRLGDGGIARFNGMGRSAADQLATLLTYEGARGRPMRRAPHSGYERLEAGETVLVADVGPAPAVADAAEAHAGCLSFELSSARAGDRRQLRRSPRRRRRGRACRPLDGGPFDGDDRRGLLRPVPHAPGRLARAPDRGMAHRPPRPGADARPGGGRRRARG